MPVVPTYTPQVREAALQPVFRGTPDVSSGARALAQGLGDVGDAAFKIAHRQAVTEAQTLEGNIKAEWYEADAQLRKQFSGTAVDGYEPAAKKWWDDRRAKAGESTSPFARNLAGPALESFRAQSVASGLAFAEREREKNLDTSYASNNALTTQGALKEATPATAQVVGEAAMSALKQSVATYGATKNWSTEQVQVEQLRQSTVLHAGMVENLMATNPGAAGKYLKDNEKTIDAMVYAKLEQRLQGAADAQEAITAADDIIAKAGGFADGKPVELDVLTQAARDRFKGDPSKSAATIAEIQHRAQAFNSAEAERTASRVSAVMGAADKGASLAALHKMPEFQKLPGDRQAAISQSVLANQQARAGLDLTNLQREQARLELKSKGTYFELSNPAKLATLSESDILAKRPELGNEQTEALLRAKRAQDKPGGLEAAKVDQDDFNNVAQSMGLRPFEADKNENEKARLGTLKSAAERAVEREQIKLKRPLTRDEKVNVMGQEMARTVKVGGMFSSEDVPVSALTPKDLPKVKVPDADRAAITKALGEKFAKTQDPRYANTDANILRTYLMGIK